VLLVNGRRISGFQEIQGIPTEAIERTDILPEEVALTYGYRADQRVVNFVLKLQFPLARPRPSGRGPTQGGRTTTEIEGNSFTIKTGATAGRWTPNTNARPRCTIRARHHPRSGRPPYDLIGNISGVPYGAETIPTCGP
jgi:hypothetical protein